MVTDPRAAAARERGDLARLRAEELAARREVLASGGNPDADTATRARRRASDAASRAARAHVAAAEAYEHAARQHDRTAAALDAWGRSEAMASEHRRAAEADRATAIARAVPPSPGDDVDPE